MKGHGILLRFIIVNTGLIHRNKLEIYKLFFFLRQRTQSAKERRKKQLFL